MNIFPDITKLPQMITVKTDDGTETFEGCGTVTSGDIKITVNNGMVLLTADTSAVKRITLRWNFPMPYECRILGDAWERGYGNLEWRGFDRDRVMPWYFSAVCGENIGCFGVKTLPDALCYFSCDRKGITLVCDTCSGSSGVILRGKTVTCAEIVCTEYKGDVSDALSDFAGRLVKRSVMPDKPVYGFNNWYYAYGNSSDEEIIENTKQLARLTKGLENRPYMVIDDCWQKKHRFYSYGYNGGPWRESNADFPDMKSLAQRITETDVLPGIWFRPLQNADDSIDEKFYSDKENFILDPTYPGVLEYIAEDVRTIVGWGYKLIKHDFSVFDTFNQWGRTMEAEPCRKAHKFYDNSVTNAQITKSIYKTIFDACDGKALIIGCNCIAHLGTGYFHIHRSGDDTSGREWERTRKLGVNTLAFRAHQHRKFFFADADCAGLTEKIDWNLNKEWLKLLAYSGTPMFVSVSPVTLNKEQEAYLAQMLAAASEERETAKPVDWMNDMYPSEWIADNKEMSFEWIK